MPDRTSGEADEPTVHATGSPAAHNGLAASPMTVFKLFQDGPNTSAIMRGIVPQVNIANFMPVVQVPAFDFTPILSGITKSIYDAVGLHTMASNALASYFAQQREQWEKLFDALRTIAEKTLPPNWLGVDNLDLSGIKPILLEEGLPLVWVPGQSTLRAILAAPDARSRRRVLGRRWKHVLDDCETVLDDVNHSTLMQHVPFAKEVASALRAGHVTAAQALGANLLDSIMRCNFSKNSVRQITKNKKGDQFDLDAYKLRVACTLGPVWRAYAEYWQDKGDAIPRSFGRHPSAHAVSRIQYSRINALTALMLVTSLLRLLDSELGM